jgi:hypothetical protein
MWRVCAACVKTYVKTYYVNRTWNIWETLKCFPAGLRQDCAMFRFVLLRTRSKLTARFPGENTIIPHQSESDLNFMQIRFHFGTSIKTTQTVTNIPHATDDGISGYGASVHLAGACDAVHVYVCTGPGSIVEAFPGLLIEAAKRGVFFSPRIWRFWPNGKFVCA